MAARRALVLINRNCRQGRRDLSDVLGYWRERGWWLECVYPDNSEQSAGLIREWSGRVDALILGGGDGTLSSAIRPAIDSGLPVGILPLGTGNDLARSLGIPIDPLAAAAVIGDGHVQRIDLGRVNDRLFFNAASIGVGVGVTRRLSYELKQRWGPLAYGIAVITALRDARPFGARIRVDGRTQYVRCIQITVGNGRYHGGGMPVHPCARIDDHLLHVYCVKPATLLQLVRLFPALRRGEHPQREELALFQGRRIEIETTRAKMIAADGEMAARTPAVFEVVAGALPMFVPRPVEEKEGLQHAAQ